MAAKRFGKMLGIDPWLINPMFSQVGGLNFAEDTGVLTVFVDSAPQG